MHYGSLVGRRDDAARFERLCPVPVAVLEAER
jgi:hypothetical protein